QVILMSASISCKEFADYFTLPVHNGLKTACVFKVEGHPYAIEEYYLDDLKHTVHFQLPSQRIEEPMIAKEMYEVAVSLILSFDELEMTKREKTNLSVTSEHGSVLVFLPGLNEISYMHSCLSRIDNTRWQVYQLHSCVPLEEQSNVFLPTVPGYRKVILSTNITESSVTVPDVKYGKSSKLCSCAYSIFLMFPYLTLFCDKQTSYQSLRLCWASKINCQQRKVTITLSSLQCCPLGTTILKVKMLDMGKPKDLLATALSPPSVSDIERTVLQLKELGALKTCVQTKENPYDGELTFLGRVLAHLPVNLHLGKLIVLGHIFGCLEECLIIAAAFSLQNFFAVPFKQHVDGYRNKLFFTENSKSDCIAIVNAFKAWQACKLKGQLR
ncbi:TDRD9 helicase, partial [Chloroceryle aenea]|nr:TDRD9 helicase [Chloroceryle aenea]